jgi:hypothetical protein
MAFKKFKEMQSGIILPDAYYKIAKVEIDIIAKRIEIIVNIYKDQESRNANYLPVESLSFAVYESDFNVLFNITEMDKSGINIIKQGYVFLRQQPEFETAINV